MQTCHDHNLVQPLPQNKPYGVRVHLRSSDPFRNLVGGDWVKEHWYSTRTERDTAMEDMSKRYLYFRPGDQPAVVVEKIEKK